MHLIAVYGFILLGLLAVSMAVVHEFTWWKRRKWSPHNGKIIGYTEKQPGSDLSYHPEIEYELGGLRRTFVSQYGSHRKPVVGAQVNVVVSGNGESAELWSVSNRVLLTIAPLLFGAICIAVGFNVEPN